MGTAGLAPSQPQLEEWTSREADLVTRGGLALPPDSASAVPSQGPVATHGLRTMPPRENCGNVDIKQLTKGSYLQIPVNVAGALYSVGDLQISWPEEAWHFPLTARALSPPRALWLLTVSGPCRRARTAAT